MWMELVDTASECDYNDQSTRRDGGHVENGVCSGLPTWGRDPQVGS